MLSLHKKIREFYRIAQEAKKSDDELDYNLVVKEELPQTKNLYALRGWLKRWDDKPYFKLEDWLPAIDTIIANGRLWHDDIDLIEKGFGKYAHPILIHLLRNYLMQEDYIGTKEYLWYEKDYVPADLLRRAQALVVKTLMEDYKYLEHDEPREEGDEKLIADRKSDLARRLGQLMDESKKLSPDLLKRLAKHFGVDAYVGAINESRGLNGVKIRNKEKYDKYDIAYLFSSYMRSSDKMHLLEIIDKCTASAKEYMRGYIYEDSQKMGRLEALFILSEDMSPMNIDYQRIAWPEGIRILTLDELGEGQRNKWGRVFQEFGIIPSS